jgi:hypothetical protein
MATIFPAVQIKPYRECERGELIRPQWGDSPLALAAQTPEGRRCVVCLTDEGGQQSPMFYHPDDRAPDRPTMSYGKGFELRVDHSHSNFEFRQYTYGFAGSLHLEGPEWFLKVAPSSPDLSEAWYNFQTGYLGKGPQTPYSARFKAWSLVIPTSDPAAPLVLYNFKPPL